MIKKCLCKSGGVRTWGGGHFEIQLCLLLTFMCTCLDVMGLCKRIVHPFRNKRVLIVVASFPTKGLVSDTWKWSQSGSVPSSNVARLKFHESKQANVCSQVVELCP